MESTELMVDWDFKQAVGKIEDELKQLGTRYAEKKQQLAGLQRKKGYERVMYMAPGKHRQVMTLLLRVVLQRQSHGGEPE